MPSFYDRRPASRTASAELHPTMLNVRAGDLPDCTNCGAKVVQKGNGTWTHATHGYATCKGVSGRATPPAAWAPPVRSTRRG